MSMGAILGYAAGVLSPLAMLAACVFELLARKLSRDPRCDKALLEKRRQLADAGLVAAWLLLAAAYLCFQYLAAETAASPDWFMGWMSWCLVLLLALDIWYLYLRRSRPRQPGKKKNFWEL